MHIDIGMKRAKMEQFAQELLDAALAPKPINVTLYGEANNQDDDVEIEIVFSNDDMERGDLTDDAVIVDVERD